MMTSLENRKRKPKEAEVVDLNFVLHSEDDEEEDCEENEGDRNLETGINDEGASIRERGLVLSLDNIPEDEFLKMIAGNDVTTGSPDPDSRSRDIIRGSRDNCDDVIGGSHDVSRDQGLVALILTPTRELSLQIRCHIMDAAKYTGIKVCFRTNFSGQTF